MPTDNRIRPAKAGLSAEALDSLAALYDHPVVRTLARAFRDADGQLYVVGGPVRDALLCRNDFSDLDFTTNLRPEQTAVVLRRFGQLWMSGASFGTVAVNVSAQGVRQKVEVTTFRTEMYETDSRKPKVGFGDDITVDLARRDLTVNAIALDVTAGWLVDPFGGIAALTSQVLDTPDDPVRTLTEDPLRILRAIRFCGKLHADLAPRMTAAVATTRERLDIISCERKLEEWNKLCALGAARRTTGLLQAAALDVLTLWLPNVSTDVKLLSATHTLSDDETLAALWAHMPTGELEATLREAKFPTARIRLIARLIAGATALRAATLAPMELRGLLRTFDDAELAASKRVGEVAFASSLPAAAAAFALAAREPAVRAKVPLPGAELKLLGLTGTSIGAALAAQERKLRETGSLTLAQAQELLELA